MVIHIDKSIQEIVKYYIEHGCTISTCSKCGLLIEIKWPVQPIDGPSLSSGMYCNCNIACPINKKLLNCVHETLIECLEHWNRKRIKRKRFKKLVKQYYGSEFDEDEFKKLIEYSIKDLIKIVTTND